MESDAIATQAEPLTLDLPPQRPLDEHAPVTPALRKALEDLVAGIIDVVILGIVFVIMSSLTGGTESEDGNFSANLDGGPAFLFFLIAIGYYLVPEALTGQTLGKKSWA